MQLTSEPNDELQFKPNPDKRLSPRLQTDESRATSLSNFHMLAKKKNPNFWFCNAPIIIRKVIAQLIHIVHARLARLAILLEVGQHKDNVLHALIDGGDVGRLCALGREIVAGRQL